MVSIPDVGDISEVISSFDNNVEKFCTQSSVPVNILISLMVFPHIPLSICHCWSMLPHAFWGKRYGVLLCGRCCMLGLIMG